MFNLSEKQLLKLDEWKEKHNKKCKGSYGAIGGKITYKFTPTSLGIIILVNCDCCKDKIDLSEYEDW